MVSLELTAGGTLLLVRSPTPREVEFLEWLNELAWGHDTGGWQVPLGASALVQRRIRQSIEGETERTLVIRFSAEGRVTTGGPGGWRDVGTGGFARSEWQDGRLNKGPEEYPAELRGLAEVAEAALEWDGVIDHRTDSTHPEGMALASYEGSREEWRQLGEDLGSYLFDSAEAVECLAALPCGASVRFESPLLSRDALGIDPGVWRPEAIADYLLPFHMLRLPNNGVFPPAGTPGIGAEEDTAEDAQRILGLRCSVAVDEERQQPRKPHARRETPGINVFVIYGGIDRAGLEKVLTLLRSYSPRVRLLNDHDSRAESQGVNPRRMDVAALRNQLALARRDPNARIDIVYWHGHNDSGGLPRVPRRGASEDFAEAWQGRWSFAELAKLLRDERTLPEARCPFVFLNTCSSLVPLDGGQLSLATAFRHRFADAILATNAVLHYSGNGPAHDPSEFACDVFRHLFAGETIGESVRLARIEDAKASRWTWAAYVLMGQPDENGPLSGVPPGGF